MGNMMNKVKAMFQPKPQQGAGYPPGQQQPMAQQQMVQQRPQYAQQQPQYAPQQQQMVQQRPQYAQQQPMVQQPQYAQQQPQYAQPPPQYGPSYTNNAYMSQYPGPPPMQLSNQPSYGNDMMGANLGGWSTADIERLRYEFSSYANPHGVIDREGFQKLYIASLLNMTWQTIERDAEAAFRSFDQDQMGTLDFNEYMNGCLRLSRGGNPSQPMYPSY